MPPAMSCWPSTTSAMSRFDLWLRDGAHAPRARAAMTWPTGKTPLPASVKPRPNYRSPFMIATHMALSRTSGLNLPRIAAALGDRELASSSWLAMAGSTRVICASKALLMLLAVDGPGTVAPARRTMPPGSVAWGLYGT